MAGKKSNFHRRCRRIMYTRDDDGYDRLSPVHTRRRAWQRSKAPVSLPRLHVLCTDMYIHINTHLRRYYGNPDHLEILITAIHAFPRTFRFWLMLELMRFTCRKCVPRESDREKPGISCSDTACNGKIYNSNNNRFVWEFGGDRWAERLPILDPAHYEPAAIRSTRFLLRGIRPHQKSVDKYSAYTRWQ